MSAGDCDDGQIFVGGECVLETCVSVVANGASKVCNDYGVCNAEGKCACNAGFKGTLCD